MLWGECREAFGQDRIWRRARRLAIGQLACLGRHTVTNLLCSCGRQFEDWSADYRVFSKDDWRVDRLFDTVLAHLLSYSSRDDPLVVALDDTQVRKTGVKTPGVAYRRDPMSPPFHCNFIRTQRFLQVSGMLNTSRWPGPARAVPLGYEHVPPVPKPRHSADAASWAAYRRQCRIENLSSRGVQLLTGLRRRLDAQDGNRPLIVGADGSYTNRNVLKHLPERTTLIGRIRHDAKLFHPPRPEDQPATGSKRRYGQPAPTPQTLRIDPQPPWQSVRAFAAGRLHDFRVKTLAPVLWKKAGADRPLRLIVIAPVGYRLGQSGKRLYRKPAYLICSDPDLPVEKILQYYL
jgi:hypothetical protein